MEQLRNPLPTLTANEKSWGLRYLLFQICFLASLLNLVNGLLSYPLSTALLNFLYFSINCIACLMIFSRFMKKNLLRTIRAPKDTLLYAAIGFAAYWLCSSFVTLLIQWVFPDYVNLNDSQIWVLTGSDPMFMIIGTVLLAPIAEEILHRGLIFGSLYSRKPSAAYGLSALLFATIHVLSYVGVYPAGYLVLALVQYLPAGLIFAWSYQRSGSIFTPMLIHMINNAVVIITMR